MVYFHLNYNRRANIYFQSVRARQLNTKMWMGSIKFIWWLESNFGIHYIVVDLMDFPYFVPYFLWSIKSLPLTSISTGANLIRLVSFDTLAELKPGAGAKRRVLMYMHYAEAWPSTSDKNGETLTFYLETYTSRMYVCSVYCIELKFIW